MANKSREGYMAVDCVILAGGLARRMGGVDKTLALLAGQSLLSRVITRLQPQVSRLAINANGPAARFDAFSLPVLPDPPAFLGSGPLAGIIAAMDWALEDGAGSVATVAGDLPFLPQDLITRLESAGPPCFAAFGSGEGRAHPTCGLWPVALRADLAALLSGGERRMMAFAQQIAARPVVWEGPRDPFTNLNTPEDFAQAEAALRDV